ncbi:hypothetical protein AB7U96_001602 [Campylobacter upsaliensis]
MKASQKSKAKFKAFSVAAGQGQAKASRVRSLEREFIKRVAAEANSPEAVRKIYAKWQGKFKANSSQI